MHLSIFRPSRRPEFRRSSAWVHVLGIVAILLAAPLTLAVAEPVAVADFFRTAAVTSAVMSPSGRYVAASMSTGGGRQRVVVMNLLDIKKSKVVAAYSDTDLQSIRWVNDDRLVFSMVDSQLTASEQWGGGLFSVDREGTEAPRRLVKPRGEYSSTERPAPGDRSLSPAHGFFSTLRDGSNDVVVYEQTWTNTGQPEGRRLWRVDTTTGQARLMTAGASPRATGWALDLKGVPRVMETETDGTSHIFWKPDAESPWTPAFDSSTFTGVGRKLNPVVVVDDVLYATANVKGDTASLVRLDLRHPKQIEPIVTLAGYDYSGNLILGRDGKLLGANYLTDAGGTTWFDPTLKAIQSKIDALLPATVNRLDCGLCDNPERVLVTAWSDRQPADYLMYDVKAGALTLLAESRPWIDAKTMSIRDMKRFTARDGLSVPVHVTRPPGPKQPAPMVVLVHGGPYLRGGQWEWYADSQFLASRGYVVVEPEYRGSTGFGYRHFHAGWKQWGLKMQDDIADATTWAIKEGYADPQRVCIAGASYGGYAALMGLVRYPEMYRCGVEWVGVTDIDLLYSIQWSDASDIWLRYGMPVLVGDPKADAAQLAATSPLKQADRITQPLLMAYGGSDQRVPIEHGIRLRDAVGKHNRNVEWVDYPGEGHDWTLPANRIDFWTRVEKFLDRNLKTGP